MIESDLDTIAQLCGAHIDWSPNTGDRRITFSVSGLNAFALRIEAQAIKSEQQGKQPIVDTSRNCTLTFFDGKLIKVAT